MGCIQTHYNKRRLAALQPFLLIYCVYYQSVYLLILSAFSQIIATCRAFCCISSMMVCKLPSHDPIFWPTMRCIEHNTTKKRKRKEKCTCIRLDTHPHNKAAGSAVTLFLYQVPIHSTHLSSFRMTKLILNWRLGDVAHWMLQRKLDFYVKSVGGGSMDVM